MRQIPYGETRSYSELAFAVGSGPRAIGRACGHNPIPIVIPCHRVLAKGGLGGYSGGEGLPTKRLLLALEGAALPEAAGRKSFQPRRPSRRRLAAAPQERGASTSTASAMPCGCGPWCSKSRS
jgi:O-6-methylguanine DNA methyltransferase